MGYYAELARQEEEAAEFNKLVIPQPPEWYEYLYFWRYPFILLILIIEVYFKIKGKFKNEN